MSNVNSRSIRRKFRRLGNGRSHNIEDSHSTFLGLIQSFLKDISRNTSSLIIHLQGSNTVSSSSNFKIHISIMIFQTLNIRKDFYFFSLFDKPHSYSSHVLFYWNSGCHKGQTSTTNRGLRAGTIGFENIRYYSNDIREIYFIWNHRAQRSFCQRSMTNLSSSRPPHGANFTNRVRREIIVKNEAFIWLILFKAVQNLIINTHHTKSGNNKRLSLTSSK